MKKKKIYLLLLGLMLSPFAQALTLTATDFEYPNKDKENMANEEKFLQLQPEPEHSRLEAPKNETAIPMDFESKEPATKGDISKLYFDILSTQGMMEQYSSRFNEIVKDTSKTLEEVKKVREEYAKMSNRLQRLSAQYEHVVANQAKYDEILYELYPVKDQAATGLHRMAQDRAKEAQEDREKAKWMEGNPNFVNQGQKPLIAPTNNLDEHLEAIRQMPEMIKKKELVPGIGEESESEAPAPKKAPKPIVEVERASHVVQWIDRLSNKKVFILLLCFSPAIILIFWYVFKTYFDMRVEDRRLEKLERRRAKEMEAKIAAKKRREAGEPEPVGFLAPRTMSPVNQPIISQLQAYEASLKTRTPEVNLEMNVVDVPDSFKKSSFGKSSPTGCEAKEIHPTQMTVEEVEILLNTMKKNSNKELKVEVNQELSIEQEKVEV